MDHLEMVEKLREKTHISYEEASAALEKSNWDLLDALLLLEGEGKLNHRTEGDYSTRAQEEAPKPLKKPAPRLLPRFLAAVTAGVKKLNAVTLQISKKGNVVLALPMTVIVLLAIFVFWWALAIGILAMFCGYRYSIKGLSIDDSVNAAMEKAGNFVDSTAKAVDVKVVVKTDGQSEEDSDDGDDAQHPAG